MTVLDQTGKRRPVTSATALPDLPAVRDEVDAILVDFLAKRAQAAPGPEMTPLFTTLSSLLDGGKRLRAHLCVTGWYAGEGRGDRDRILRMAASLELFHAFALIHDDVMDRSDLRRGRPTAHHALATAYVADGHPPRRATAHGLAAGLLLGDLVLTLSDDLIRTGPGAEATWQIQPLLETMRSQLVYGQYLDLMATGRPCDDIEAALRIVRYKTASYTVEWPLRIGAALAGAGPDVHSACSEFAIPLGEAFQLRDDLLGVFGDPAKTGKPVGDDIREGKATVLMALALQSASAADKRLLRTAVGNPDLSDEDFGRVRDVIEHSGARRQVETMITARRHAALTVLDRAPFPFPAAEALREIAGIATVRQS
ncbi:polyprenyl synthetase family protein [Streptomyces lavendulocolor]|uniref:Polyprenyl synthetase family protein n=1 Tax=Streptomyces lavendulocolor TaxID=67316 RepID=A0ABV2W1Z9_9ACTN|nr:polyprenyl synthetase [Streptomyces cellulosae]